MSKKNNKLAGIIIGPVMVIGGMMALWENEGRFNYYEAAKETTPIQSINTHPGETISYTSDLDTSIPIAGYYVKEFMSYLLVERRAEIYSWEEDTDSDGNTTWSKGWYSSLDNNHRNNGLVQKLRSGDLYPDRYVVGDMTISPEKIHFVDDDVDVSINNISLSDKGRALGLSRTGYYLYLRKGRSDNLGDERISYTGIPVSKVASYFGLVSGGQGVGKQFDISTSWVSGIIGNDGMLHHLVNGERDVALDKIESYFNKVVWFTRLGGTLAIIFGFHIFFSIFVGLLYRIPLLGDLVEMGVFVVSLILGLVISLFIIVTSLLVHNLFTITLPVIGLLVAIVYFKRRSANTSEHAREILSRAVTKAENTSQPNLTEQTFTHLAGMALAENSLSKKENKILVKWGSEQGISESRMKELFDDVKKTNISAKVISRKDLELLILMALSDGDLSSREMHLLQKYGEKISMSSAELKNIINDIESGKLAY